MSESPNARLTGKELVALVESMPKASRTELVQAAGYVAADGRRCFTDFYVALLEARGHVLPKDEERVDGRATRPVSFRTTVLSHGGLLIGKRYVQDALGLAPGGKAAIAVKDGKLTLVADRS